MMIIHCTKKLLKEIARPLTGIEDIPADDSGLGNWYADIFRFNRKKYFVFTNEQTLYTFFVYDIKKDDIESITSLFKEKLARYLKVIGIDDSIISQITADYKEIGFSRTDNSTVEAAMNYFSKLFEARLEYIDEITEREIIISNLQVNTTPMGSLKYDDPLERLKGRIAEKYSAVC